MSALSTDGTPAGGRAPLLRGRGPELAAAAFGLGWFLLMGGYRALPPTHLDWLYGGDPVQHLLGWLFFREAPPLSFPLGAVPSYTWPVGTTVALTDGNPLLAILARPLSPILPRDFQYIGAWLAACFALQGWAGARVGALASPAPGFRFAAGALFALAPPLTGRIGHATLCAHAVVVGLLVLNAAPHPGPAGARSALRRAAALTLVISAIHPYLAVMALALTLALAVRLVRLDGTVRPRVAWTFALGLVAAQFAVFAAFGYLSAPSHASGFGLFSADLLTFFDPAGGSRLLPSLPLEPGQWEGSAYLGLGGLALAAVALWAAVARRRALGGGWRLALPAAIVALAFFAFALSSKITVGGAPVLDLKPLYRPLAGAVAPLRASGRFVWPLYYLVLGAAVVSLPRTLGLRAATAVLGAAVALQLVDVSGRIGTVFQDHPWREDAPEWALARGHYDHLAMYPPQLKGTGTNRVCGDVPGYDPDAYAPLAYRAYDLGITFNSGYLSRGHRKKLTAACTAFLADVDGGRLDPRTIYVIHPAEEARFRALPVTCGRLAGRLVCVRADNADPFRGALAQAAAAAAR